MLNKQIQNEAGSDWERVNILDARSEKEKQDIYRFRYYIYVDEMKRKIPGIDHLRKRVFDELDSWSHLSYAEIDGRVVGTLRMTLGHMNDFPMELVRILQLDRFQAFSPQANNLCLGTKIMVHPMFRNTPVSFRLMARGYEIMREYDAQFSFTGCNSYLIPMYEQLGYFRYTCGFQDPGYGFVNPVVILPQDIDHLRAVRSPFLRMARKLQNSPVAKQWLQSNMPDAFRYPIGLLTTEQEHWDIFAQRIAAPLTWSILRNLDEGEARRLLNIGATLELCKGQQFIRNGDVCNELNILVSGEMGVVNSTGSSYTAKSGAILGSMGLLGQTNHTVDAMAITDCEVLAISRFPFEKLLRSMPGLAKKLNLTEKTEGF